ncbi:hypothetical protein SDC9_199518 [bioreactor metagenome]|uniref:Uncharacterized protein n=1 Tax=bioreactor metagenome TaxID=1076179 RepID=A0A645IKP4_9ZZZZ
MERDCKQHNITRSHQRAARACAVAGGVSFLLTAFKKPIRDGTHRENDERAQEDASRRVRDRQEHERLRHEIKARDAYHQPGGER